MSLKEVIVFAWTEQYVRLRLREAAGESNANEEQASWKTMERLQSMFNLLLWLKMKRATMTVSSGLFHLLLSVCLSLRPCLCLCIYTDMSLSLPQSLNLLPACLSVSVVLSVCLFWVY